MPTMTIELPNYDFLNAGFHIGQNEKLDRKSVHIHCFEEVLHSRKHRQNGLNCPDR